MADDVNKKLKDVNEELGYVEEQIINIADRLSSAVKGALEDIRDEAKGIGEIFGKNLSKSIKDIAKGSDTILKNTQKLYDGSAKVKDIQKDINNLEIKRLATLKNIEISARNLLLSPAEQEKAERELGEAIAAQNALLTEQLSLAGAIEKKAKEEADRMAKTLGATGALMKGMSKIPFLGDLPGMKDVLSEVEDEIKAIEKAEGRIVSQQEAMNMAFKKMGGIVKDSLTDPLVVTAITTKLLVSSFKALWEIGMKADAEIVSLSKSMAISTDQATEMRNRFKEIQDAGGSIYETTTNLVGAQLELAAAFGATTGFTEKQLKDQILLTKQMGFSVEEAQGLQQLAAANGMSAKDVTNSVIKQTSALAKQTGIQLDNKKVIGEVAKVSGQLRLQYQNNPALIAQAVVQTQKLGISLETAAKSSRSLLDFESSISNELEAELLTGKDLNLEKARLLALNGDIAGSSAEMLKQVGSAAEFGKMNVLQQESLAKAVGMSADELANSLIQQENLNRLGSESKKQIEEKAELLRKNGDIDGANKLMNSIGNEKEAQDALAKINAQDKFNASMDKMKAILTSIVDGPATMLVNLISSTVEFATRFSPIFKAAAIALTPILGILTVMWIRTQAITIMASIKTAFETFGAVPVVGFGLALAAAATGAAYINSQPKPAGDMYSPSDGKTQVSTKEGGLFELSKNDSLYAFPEKKGNPTSSGGGSAKVDVQISAGNTIIQLDGLALAKAITPYVVEQMRQTSVKVQ
jgi:hypothetical protein